MFCFIAAEYPTAEKLSRSLREGKIDYVLVDMYLPVKRRDLFNGSWFEIASLLPVELSHGVVLQGDAFKLASELEELIAYDNVQTKFLEDDDNIEVNFTCAPVVFFVSFSNNCHKNERQLQPHGILRVC